MYVKKSINYNVLKVSEKIASEYLFVEVVFTDSKILSECIIRRLRLKSWMFSKVCF